MPASPHPRLIRPALATMILAGALAGTGCGLELSMRAESRNDWTKSYDVAPGATLDLRSTNGEIRVQAADVKQIEVKATRIVRASTDEAAKAALADFAIKDTASSDRVLVDASQPSGLSIGLSLRADFDVKVPRGVSLDIKGANSEITVTGIDGALRIVTSNGRIVGDGLAGPADVTATNGTIRLDLVKIADGGVTCETTNGAVVVGLPRDGSARLSARVTNGAISTGDLPLQITDQSRQRLEATLGSGGPAVKIQTTNGAVSFRASGNKLER